MTNATLLARLQALGPLPDAKASAADDFPLTEFDELVQQLTAPLSQEHATALIDLGPPPSTGCFGVEWTLLHKAELVKAIELLQQAVAQAADTEVKRMAESRLATYFKAQQAT
ncbi:MAG: hypothetical protein ACRYFX_03655 [Janthinobacterium lividum]